MHEEERVFACVAFALGLAVVGCQQEEPKSPDDIDSTQGSFSANYSERLGRISKGARAREAKAKEDIGSMPTFPEQLGDDVPADKAIAILDAADKAGRDEGYGEEARKMAVVQEFFDDEKDPLSKKVGNAAQWAAKQKGCNDVDLWGPISQGVKDGFDDRIKERMHKHNDAFLLIDQNREAWGKKNVTALEDEADKVTEASYIVHVQLPDKKKRLDYAVAQIPKQMDRLTQLIKDEKDRASKEKMKPEDQKASDQHLKDWNEALNNMDAAGQEAKTNAADLDDRVKSLDKDYDAGFSAMKDVIKNGKKKQ